MAPAEALQVEVVYCAAAGHVEQRLLQLPPGATLAEAVVASGFAQVLGAAAAGLHFGIWGKARDGDTPLRIGDRVEIYRPLTVDPKEARRQRYQRHRERHAKPPARVKP